MNEAPMVLCIENETDFSISSELNETLHRIATFALCKEYGTDNFEISLLLVHDDEIQRMNQGFRQIDAATDVLSFPLYEAGEPFEKISPIALGDIVISVDRAKEQAASFEHSLTREICFLVVHGLLHLMGYDHEKSPADETVMFQKQDEILTHAGVRR